MTAKSFLIVGALALTSIGIASAKSYDVVLSANSKAGNTQLKAGEYKLKVDGSMATFTDQDSKTFSVPVKVANAGKKFNATTIETTSNAGDMDSITAIDLAGSNTKIEFGQ
ncbi:MAG TPA: hypothetical protein VG297_04485 [Bryobacteraceae bacterium]|jgi:hypothetical protein|nr:hypothetical protein [Bryobacteraceae bacterium]